MNTNQKFNAWCVIEGKTDRVLAETLGLDPSYVWLLRKGQRQITDAVRWKFAEAYGYETALKVLGEPEPAKREPHGV